MKLVKSVLNVSLVFLMVLALFSSCEKEDMDDQYHDHENTTQNAAGNFLQLVSDDDDDDSASLDSLEECFQIVYPISIEIPGTGTQEVNSDEELEEVIDEFFENAGNDIEDYPMVVFPIEVTLADGSTQTVNDDEELCDLYYECYGDDEWDDEWDDDDDEWDDDEYEYEECFEFVYPITVELDDGTTQTIEDEEGWEELYDDEGDYQYFEIVFPVTIELEDGTTQTVENEEDLEELFADCYEDFDYEDCDSIDIEDLCFDFVYPINMELPDGSTVEVNSDDELWESIITYYEENPNSDEEPTFTYPLEVVLEDGSTQTVNDDDELEELFEECFGDGFGLQNPNVTQGMARMNRSN